MLTLGVDAARGGWIAVALRDGAFADAVLERRFPALLERFAEAVAVGVDVPIGFPELGTRRPAPVREAHVERAARAAAAPGGRRHRAAGAPRRRARRGGRRPRRSDRRVVGAPHRPW